MLGYFITIYYKINTKSAEGRGANAVAWVLTPLLCCLATWQKAERVQIHATFNWDARTTARNWRLSQSEAEKIRHPHRVTEGQTRALYIFQF